MLSLVKPPWDSGHNLLLLDLRGHGESTHVRSTYGINEQWGVSGADPIPLTLLPIQHGNRPDRWQLSG